MIELKTTETTLELYHQGKRVLSHTGESPAFYLGEGTCAIEMYRGNYDIEDYIATRIPLRRFQADGLWAKVMVRRRREEPAGTVGGRMAGV
ncbi:MAG: hypothetical protein ACLFUQ_02040 [Candidatus Izemoplasmataceae bacterium]